MQNAAAEGETCLPCPTNAICRGGCKDNPSATLCSDPLYEPRDITSLFLLGLCVLIDLVTINNGCDHAIFR